MLARFDLDVVELNYFCPKHGKGGWDRLIGVLGTLFEHAVLHTQHDTVSDVVMTFVKWAFEEMRLHPEGPAYLPVEFFPEKRDSYDFRDLTRACLGRALNQAFSWTFSRRDKRRRGPTSLMGAGVRCFEFTNVAVRNHLMSGVPGRILGNAFVCTRELRRKMKAEKEAAAKALADAAAAEAAAAAAPLALEDEAGEAEEEPEEPEEPDADGGQSGDDLEADDDTLGVNTRSFRGWRTSFLKPQKNAPLHRRRYLYKQSVALEPAASSVAPGQRFRPVADVVQSALATAAAARPFFRVIK